MNDLAAWLLEQIAVDEAPTFELVPYRCEPGCCAPAGWVGHRCLICGTEEFGGTPEAITKIAREHDEVIHRRGRGLAECAAKRRIITECGWVTVMRLLAQPYADRPGWRQEWDVQ